MDQHGLTGGHDEYGLRLGLMRVAIRLIRCPNDAYRGSETIATHVVYGSIPNRSGAGYRINASITPNVYVIIPKGDIDGSVSVDLNTMHGSHTRFVSRGGLFSVDRAFPIQERQPQLHCGLHDGAPFCF